MKKHRNLRTNVRRRKNRPAKTYYVYDMRSYGQSDISLGSDLKAALVKWAELDALYVRRPVTLRPQPKRDAFSSLPSWARVLYRAARTRARTFGRVFSLTKDEFVAVFHRDQVCAVSGSVFEFGGRRNPSSPSLDRRDSSVGYAFDNVRLVTLAANMAMNSWGENALYALAAMVAKKRPANEPASLRTQASQCGTQDELHC